MPFSSSQSRSASKWGVPLLGLLVLVIAGWQFFSAIDDREFHRDEARWIHRATYLREGLHPFSDYWVDTTWVDGASMDERFRLRAQPPVGSYVIGLGMLLQGEPLPDIGYWNMDHDTEWNADNGNLPTSGQLLSARRTTATIGVLTAILVYLVGLRLSTPVGAAMGAIFFALHPLARYLSTFVGSDITLAFFIALSAWLAGRLAEQPNWRRTVPLGIAIGLGAGTKLSPLGTGFALAAVGIVLVAWQWRQRSVTWQLGWMLMSVPAIAAGTFVATYPYLWRNPIQHSRNVLDYRTLGMDIQGQLWNQVAIDSPAEAIHRSWQRFGSVEWSVLGRFFGLSLPAELLISLAGAGILLLLIRQRGLISAVALIAVVLGATVGITFVGMGVDWARYHLPILLAMAMCFGLTFGTLHKWLIRMLKT